MLMVVLSVIPLNNMTFAEFDEAMSSSKMVEVSGISETSGELKDVDEFTQPIFLEEESIIDTEDLTEKSLESEIEELSAPPLLGGNLADEVWNEEDFYVSGVNCNGLTPKGKEKLAAKDGALEIPNMQTSHGNKVSIIATDKFKNLGIKSLVINDNIEEIGMNAFYGNEIMELALPASVTEIKPSAFAKNQISVLTLSEGLKIIYPFAFEYNQIKEVVIPDSVTEIRVKAFENNPGDEEHDNKVVLYVSDVDKINFYNDTKDTYFIKIKDSEEYLAKDFTYSEKSQYGKDFIEITGLSDSGREKREKNHVLNIPSVIYGKEVRSIQANAFRNTDLAENIKFEKVILPKELKNIGEAAFSGNSISAVNFGNKLEIIGANAFSYNQLTEVLIPETVKEIGLQAFANNQIEKGNAKIDNVKGKVKIGIEAFDIEPVYLKMAPKFTITTDAPNGVTVMITPEEQAKEGARVTVKYTITDTSKELLSLKVKKRFGEVNLVGNTFIMPKEDVTIEIRIKDKYSENKWCIEDFRYFRYELGDIDDENYINEMTVNGFSEKGMEKLKKNKEVVLPEINLSGEEVEAVYEKSFENKGITKLTVPKNYKKLYEKAFKGNAISELVLSEGLVFIFDETFANNKLTEFIAPKSFQYASKGAFKGNELRKVVLTDSVKSIGPESFMNNKISELILGNRTERIYSNAFTNNQLAEINIPKTLKKQSYSSLPAIYSDAFNGNPGTKNPLKPSENKVLLWTPDEDNPNHLPNGENYVVDPVVENNEYLSEDFVYNADNEVEGFSKSGSKKFEKMKDRSVTLPEKNVQGIPVVGIAEAGFNDDASYIQSITIPEGYKKIGDQAFSYSEISEIDAPSTLEEVGDYSFLMSANVVKIHVTKAVAEKITNTSDYWELVVDKEELATPQPGNDSVWHVSDFTYGILKVTKTEEDGTETKLSLKAVTGFSENGLEKVKTLKDLVLPSQNSDGEKIEAVANEAFKGDFGKKRLNSLEIPEGYRVIGSMAFAFNGCGGELVLPDSMEFVDGAAFFRNEFTSLIVPEKITDISLSMMRGNKLNKVTFKGNVETIGRLAFSENKIEEITVPDSLKTIGEQAFTTNTGSDKYGDKVVIRTVSGKNPNNLEDKENYIIDPKKPGTTPPINYKEWTTDDFEYEGTKVTGFSKQGHSKIKRNKNLIVPDKTPDGKNVLIIGIDAFRNLNQGYDIESVQLPDTVTEIEDYALQFNNINSVKLPRDLKKLGMGVFMMSNVTNVEWNEELEYIDQACFFMCELGQIELPASVKTIMNAAFRKCALTQVRFAEGSKLKEIENLAFADNKLSNIAFPQTLVTIGSQAFGDNQFTELNVPASLGEIGFQAFVNNSGMQKYNGAVVIHTPEGKNPKGLVDDAGKTFVIDPEMKAGEADKQALKIAIDAAKKIDSSKLTEAYKTFFEETLKSAETAYADKQASKARVVGLTKEMIWANKRAELNTLMFEKEKLDPKASTFDKNKWVVVQRAYAAAKKSLMVINITDTKVEQLINELAVALKALDETTDPLAGATAYDGEANVPKTHYITPYTIKVRVWVKDGKIVHVIDNGTVCDDPDDDEEHNGGYYKSALPIMHKYIGKTVEAVLGNKLGKNLGIDAISHATVSSNVIHKAVQNALKKASEPSEIETAKQQLQKYIDSIKLDVLKLTGIATDSNKDEIEKFHKHLEKAQTLLAKENKDITPEELKEMQGMPSYKKDGKKVKGSFSKIVKEMRADFKVIGDRTQKNKHNNENYPVVQNGEIKIETAVKNLQQTGKRRLYLNYVTEEEYNKQFDANTGATPKYDKKEVPAENYSVTNNNDGTYTLKIKTIPNDAVILKPVLKVELAEITFVENGDLVYVKETDNPNENNSNLQGNKDQDKKEKNPSSKSAYNETQKNQQATTPEDNDGALLKRKNIVTIFTVNANTVLSRVNGIEVTKTVDVAPYIKNNRTMVSARFISEALGYEVKWDNKTKSAIFSDGKNVLKIQIYSDEMTVNGKVFKLDNKPEVVKGRIMLPISSIIRSLALTQGVTEDKIYENIIWDGKNKTITISIMK